MHIMDFFEYLASLGLGNNNIRHYRANISKALKRAVIHEIISSNSIDKMENIKSSQFIGSFYSIQELEQLMKVIDTNFLELPILISSFYGLRRSEVIGIKWNYIDFEQKTIVIKHTVGYGKVNGVTQFIFLKIRQKRNGVKLEDIQAWLGHSSYQTTLRYTHLDDEAKKGSRNVISNFFKKGQKNKLF